MREVGGTLVAAHDPHDSVGVLDAYFPEAAFFTEIERFDRHLDKLARQGKPIDYLVVCSPNYLHDAHCRLGLRLGADIICEKPVTLNPWNLDSLAELEAESERRIWCILQSRLHPSFERLQVLAKAVPLPHRHEAMPSPALADAPRLATATAAAEKVQVAIDYVTPRGPWYRYSWKGQAERSGGIVTNIGIHLFDAVLAAFGEPTGFSVNERTVERAVGQIEFATAQVSWQLSVRRADLPAGRTEAYRSFVVNGEAIDFSSGFEALHVESYRRILAGQGFGLRDARPAVALVSAMRQQHKP